MTEDVKTKKPPKLTQAQRWSVYCGHASNALSRIESELDALEEAMTDLTDMQQEFIDKRDNMPENLTNSAYGEKLNAVADLDLSDAVSSIQDAIDELRGKIDEADGTDLPLGFGRD